MLVSLVVVAALSVQPVRASGVSNTPSNLWVTDGTVTDAVEQGDLVYLAGSFSRVGPRTGPLTFLDPITGEPRPGTATVTGGDISAVVADGIGGYFNNGSFTTVGGFPRKGVARLTSSGAVDPAFASAALDGVSSLVVIGSRVFVSGYRTDASGFFSGVVAFDRLTGTTLPWTPSNPSAPYGPAKLFALPSGTLVASHVSTYAPAVNYEYDPMTGAMIAQWPVIPWVTVDANTVIGSAEY